MMRQVKILSEKVSFLRYSNQNLTQIVEILRYNVKITKKETQIFAIWVKIMQKVKILMKKSKLWNKKSPYRDKYSSFKLSSPNYD